MSYVFRRRSRRIVDDEDEADATTSSEQTMTVSDVTDSITEKQATTDVEVTADRCVKGSVTITAKNFFSFWHLCGLTFFRLKIFRASLLELFQAEHAQSLELSRVIDHVNAKNPTAQFSRDEILAAVQKMTDENQIMLSDDVIFLIWTQESITRCVPVSSCIQIMTL